MLRSGCIAGFMVGSVIGAMAASAMTMPQVSRPMKKMLKKHKRRMMQMAGGIINS